MREMVRILGVRRIQRHDRWSTPQEVGAEQRRILRVDVQDVVRAGLTEEEPTNRCAHRQLATEGLQIEVQSVETGQSGSSYPAGTTRPRHVVERGNNAWSALQARAEISVQRPVTTDVLVDEECPQTQLTTSLSLATEGYPSANMSFQQH
jgi:hypothetical protein